MSPPIPTSVSKKSNKNDRIWIRKWFCGDQVKLQNLNTCKNFEKCLMVFLFCSCFTFRGLTTASGDSFVWVTNSLYTLGGALCSTFISVCFKTHGFVHKKSFDCIFTLPWATPGNRQCLISDIMDDRDSFV